MNKLTKTERRWQRSQRIEYANIIADFEAEKKAKAAIATATASAAEANAILRGAA